MDDRRGRESDVGTERVSRQGNGMPVAGCGDVRPVADVANRIGHTRRPVFRRGSSSGTRPKKLRREASCLLCGSIKVQLQIPACMQIPVGSDPSGCPPFYRPNRGRKKAAPRKAVKTNRRRKETKRQYRSFPFYVQKSVDRQKILTRDRY